MWGWPRPQWSTISPECSINQDFRKTAVCGCADAQSACELRSSSGGLINRKYVTIRLCMLVRVWVVGEPAFPRPSAIGRGRGAPSAGFPIPADPRSVWKVLWHCVSDLFHWPQRRWGVLEPWWGGGGEMHCGLTACAFYSMDSNKREFWLHLSFMTIICFRNFFRV